MLGELTQEQIDDVLRAQTIGRIGCVHEGRPYVVPITYAYDGESVYGHSGEGMKLRAMRADPRVCFEVEQIDNMANWRSVVAWGVFEELHGVDAEVALRRLVTRFLPMLSSETAQPPPGIDPTVQHPSAEGKHAVLFRIRLTERTGRFERR